VLLNIVARSTQATTILGVSVVEAFESLAERHINEIRYVFFVYVDHDGKQRCTVTPQNFTNVSFIFYVMELHESCNTMA
jgi:hypothetical protein